MNKVVSIEIAGQVFSTDEEAYEVLHAYLKKIHVQLSAEEEAADILNDIELRIAELLYAFRSDDKKAISIEQVNEVIEQVGFIDSDIEAIETPRRFFLDQQNKIIAGVCAGLAMRFRVPAFIVRLIFLLLTPLAGLGIILYLVFWMSFDSNTSRNAVLAAQGKAQTAKSIAAVGGKSEGAAHQIQRIIFLPFSLIGALFTVIANHFRKRSGGYLRIMKNIVAFVLLGFATTACIIMYAAFNARVFPTLIALLLFIAAMYLVVLGLAIYFRDYYLSNPHFQIARRLKVGAVIPAGMLVATMFFLLNAWDVYQQETIERSYPLAGNLLNLQFIEDRPLDTAYGSVRISMKTSDSPGNQVRIAVDYSGYGFNAANAEENLRNVEYVYALNGNTLELNEFWSLSEGELSRGQRVNVLIEVPQNVAVRSLWPLVINRDGSPYIYSVGHSYYDDGGTYLASGEYFHEVDAGFRDRLSENERVVLQDKFCEEFYISEYRNCRYHIQMPVQRNYQFDRAFQEDLETIEQVRTYLLPNRSLFVSNLYEVNDLIQNLSVNLTAMSEFQEYLLYLAEVKLNPQLL
ncbi:MAG: PspC domain-containing protein [Proteobacteria bacterium]|nr:PspC domain-containing protein [Pseudomonadota bacterium]